MSYSNPGTSPCRELTTSPLKEIGYGNKGFFSVHVAGAEPTVYPDLPAAINMANYDYKIESPWSVVYYDYDDFDPYWQGYIKSYILVTDNTTSWACQWFDGATWNDETLTLFLLGPSAPAYWLDEVTSSPESRAKGKLFGPLHGTITYFANQSGAAVQVMDTTPDSYEEVTLDSGEIKEFTPPANDPNEVAWAVFWIGQSPSDFSWYPL